jgi:hypothetical protein
MLLGSDRPVRWFALAIANLGCSAEPLERPAPPDMSALVAAYESPDGTLNELVMLQALLFVSDRRQLVEDLGIDRELLAVVRDVFESEYDPNGVTTLDAELGVHREPLAVLSEGYLVARRICAGFQGVGRPDAERDGWLRLLATFTAAGPDPVVWGEAVDCRYGVEDRRIVLGIGGGDVRLHIGRGLGFDDVGSEPVIFDLDLEAALDDQPIRFDFDFRVLGTEAVELRVPRDVVPAAAGELVVQYSGGELIGVRAGNGSFICDPTAFVCRGEDGETLELPQPLPGQSR